MIARSKRKTFNNVVQDNKVFKDAELLVRSLYLTSLQCDLLVNSIATSTYATPGHI